ncbi:hypothetical protein AKO1_010300 [Acrasis kona]|uniref:EGF-like domain-containing protein n=1 Tax=Acrasis kona TaxID=1008807 RepID=A0AAW2ZQU3_9EUKA
MYKFTLQVVKGNRTASVHQVVRIVPGRRPIVSLDGLNPTCNSNDKIVIYGSFSFPEGSTFTLDSVNFWWAVQSDHAVDLNTKNLYTNANRDLVLAFKPNVLKPGSEYKFRLTVRTLDGTEGYAEIITTVNMPPIPGRLYVDENIGAAMTQYRFVTTEWVTSTNTNFIFYYFSYKNNYNNEEDYDNDVEYVLGSPSYDNVATVSLPKGNYPNGTLRVFINAVDENGAIGRFHKDIYVPPLLPDSASDLQIMQGINASLSKADASMCQNAASYIYTVTSLITPMYNDYLCVADEDCMGHGECNMDNSHCKCDANHAGADCSFTKSQVALRMSIRQRLLQTFLGCVYRPSTLPTATYSSMFTIDGEPSTTQSLSQHLQAIESIIGTRYEYNSRPDLLTPYLYHLLSAAHERHVDWNDKLTSSLLSIIGTCLDSIYLYEDFSDNDFMNTSMRVISNIRTKLLPMVGTLGLRSKSLNEDPTIVDTRGLSLLVQNLFLRFASSSDMDGVSYQIGSSSIMIPPKMLARNNSVSLHSQQDSSRSAMGLGVKLTIQSYNLFDFTSLSSQVVTMNLTDVNSKSPIQLNITGQFSRDLIESNGYTCREWDESSQEWIMATDCELVSLESTSGVCSCVSSYGHFTIGVGADNLISNPPLHVVLPVALGVALLVAVVLVVIGVFLFLLRRKMIADALEKAARVNPEIPVDFELQTMPIESEQSTRFHGREQEVYNTVQYHIFGSQQRHVVNESAEMDLDSLNSTMSNETEDGGENELDMDHVLRDKRPHVVGGGAGGDGRVVFEEESIDSSLRSKNHQVFDEESLTTHTQSVIGNEHQQQPADIKINFDEESLTSHVQTCISPVGTHLGNQTPHVVREDAVFEEETLTSTTSSSERRSL